MGRGSVVREVQQRMRHHRGRGAHHRALDRKRRRAVSERSACVEETQADPGVAAGKTGSHHLHPAAEHPRDRQAALPHGRGPGGHPQGRMGARGADQTRPSRVVAPRLCLRW